MAPERRGRTLLHSPRAPHGVPHRSIARQKILTGGSIHMYGRHGIRAIRRVIERLDFALTAGRWKPIIRIPCYRANRGISGAREDPSSGLRLVVAPLLATPLWRRTTRRFPPPASTHQARVGMRRPIPGGVPIAFVSVGDIGKSRLRPARHGKSRTWRANRMAGKYASISEFARRAPFF